MDKKINITICCPSRGRPELAHRMQTTALDTADDPDSIAVKFYLNTDDPLLAKYQEVLKDYQIGEDRSTVYSWNMLAEETDSKLFMLAGDDIQFMTQGWDTKFLSQFNKYPDGIFLISFKDGRTGPKNGTRDSSPHPVVSEQWRRSLGYYFPFMFHHWFVDTYTRDIAKEIGRYIYLDDVTIKAKKIFDNTGEKVRSKGIPDRDKFVFEKMKQCYFDHDVTKLKRAMR